MTSAKGSNILFENVSSRCYYPPADCAFISQTTSLRWLAVLPKQFLSNTLVCKPSLAVLPKMAHYKNVAHVVVEV